VVKLQWLNRSKEHFEIINVGKGKVIPIQAWKGPEGSQG